MEQMDVLQQILQLLGGNNDFVVKLLVFMGAMRICMKPLMVFIETVIKQTPTQIDDEWLAKIQTSKWYKILSFVLDYVASIKLPQEKKV